jgi:hypothetical protein
VTFDLIAPSDVTEVSTDVEPVYGGELEPIEPGMAGEVACAENYCHNEGSCTVTRNGMKVCLCRAGFTGDRCEKGERERSRFAEV